MHKLEFELQYRPFQLSCIIMLLNICILLVDKLKLILV